MNKIIAVASGKGGTGKSTVSVGLGRELANDGNKVLLIDCDSGMRGLDLMLGVTKNLVFDMANAVGGDCDIEKCVYPCSSNGNLFLIPAPKSAEDELSPAVFRNFLDAVQEIFDYIIIDSPAGVGTGFETAVSFADLALVVCNAEPISLRGCVNVRNRLTQCGIKNLRLVINRFEENKFLGMGFYSDLDMVIDSAGIRLIGVIPEDNRMIAAIQTGRLAEKSSKAISAFKRLAQRVEGQKVPLVI